MNLVLVGPHGAGKTTLGHQLAARLGLCFHRELGRDLAEDPTWRPTGVTAHDHQAGISDRFDAELFRRELARDRAWGGTPRIVETWHPGNLAYARRRAPGVVRRHLREIRVRCLATPTVVLPVTASLPTLAARQSEPGQLSAFVAVGRDASAQAAALGLRLLPPVHTDEQSAATLAAVLAPRLRALLSPPSPRPRSSTCASS